MLAAAVVTLPKNRGSTPLGEREADLGVAVEAAVDDVVVQRMFGSQWFTSCVKCENARRLSDRRVFMRLPSLLGHDFGDDLLEAGAVGRGLAQQARGILTAFLLQVSSLFVRFVSSISARAAPRSS